MNQLSTLAGLQPPLTPPVLTLDPNLFGGYPQSLANLGLNRFNNFRVGVAISLPLHNRTAEGQLGHSLVEGRRIATQREQLDIGSRVKIEHEATRQRGMVRLAIPRMEFHGGDLGHGDQPFDAIDLEVGLAVTFDGGQLHQVGHARHRVALEELLIIDAIGRADDGARPSLEMLDHPRTNLFEIGGKIALGDRLPFLLGRPQRLVGVGYDNAHNDGARLG